MLSSTSIRAPLWSRCSTELACPCCRTGKGGGGGGGGGGQCERIAQHRVPSNEALYQHFEPYNYRAAVRAALECGHPSPTSGVKPIADTATRDAL